MQKLSKQRIKSFGYPIFLRVFKKYRLATNRPFSTGMRFRFLIYPCDFRLSEMMAKSLEEATKFNGEEYVLATYVVSRRYERGNDQPFWLVNFSELQDLSREMGPIVYTLISLTGDWGIIFDYEGFALLGCTKAFAKIVTLYKSDIHNQVLEFLTYWKEMEQEKYIDTTWIPPLLRYVYGREHSKELMKLVGSNFSKRISNNMA